MENKYFAPDIEDICIGYELEAKITNFPDRNNWIPIVIKGFVNVKEYHDAGIYRVPYLTKEQIEAEGWVEDKGLYKLRKNEDLFFTIDFNTDSYSLIINSYSKINTTFYSGNCILKGKCKDINTFRRIIKLLEI